MKFNQYYLDIITIILDTKQSLIKDKRLKRDKLQESNSISLNYRKKIAQLLKGINHQSNSILIYRYFYAFGYHARSFSPYSS